MASTTIKVPVELRDRLAVLASRDNTTLAGAIVQSLDAAESAAFWADVARTMGTTSVGALLSSEIEQLGGSLTDGLDPEETWDDVW
jgi:predicted transcriptional regulator